MLIAGDIGGSSTCPVALPSVVISGCLPREVAY